MQVYLGFRDGELREVTEIKREEVLAVSDIYTPIDKTSSQFESRIVELG